MRIAFFGASVTAQSGENSYIHHLQALIPHYQILKSGIGACHFDDAGFYKLEEVLQQAPARVVLEWNTTGLSAFNMLKLGSVVRQVLEAGALPSFLILPRRDSIGVEPRLAEVQVREFCQRYSIPVLDLTPGFNPDGMLRDMVHTTPQGAMHYAAQLATWLADDSPSPGDDCLGLQKLVPKTHPISTEISAGIGLAVHARRSGEPLEEIVAEVIVGPNIVNLEIDTDGRVHLLSLVDRWCYYERRMFRLLWKGNDANYRADLEISLRAAKEPPDYSMLDKPRVSSDAPPHLKILGLYSAGIELQRIDYRDSAA